MKEGFRIPHSILRILDANLNRAREAARVMEEYARFVLNDATLAGQAKQLRHELADVLGQSGLGDLVRGRDIIGDVGRELRAEGEYHRTTTTAVATAAGKRYWIDRKEGGAFVVAYVLYVGFLIQRG